MSIIVVLATLAMLITPRFAEDQRTDRGADLIQGWLLGAKQRAYRDQVPRGIRLVRSSDNSNWVRELVWIERPEDVKGEPDPSVTAQDRNHLQVPSPIQTPKALVPAPPIPPNAYVFLPWDAVTGDVVMPGDWLKVVTYENVLHRIAAVTAVRGGTVLLLAAGDGTPSPVLPGAPGLPGARIGLAADTRYRIVRGTRPMSGEPNLQLPSGVSVDLDPTTNGVSVLSGAADGLDILFDQRGQLMGGNGVAGKVVLRVRNTDRPATFGQQIFVLVFSRTGLISACPLGDVNDPYVFTRSLNQNGF